MKNLFAVYLTAMAATAVGWTAAVDAENAGILFGIKAVDGQLIARALDLSDSRPALEHGKLAERSDERLSAVFQKKDRAVAVVRTLLKPHSIHRASVRLVGTPEHFIDASTTDVAGLASSYAISSVLIPVSGLPLALVAHYSDTPPFSLANIDLASGRIDLIKPSLNAITRYSHLIQCPDTRIYAVSMAPQYDVRLVQLDIAKQTTTRLARLKLSGEPLHFEIKSLACGPSGAVYALADPSHSGANILLTVDLASGNMILLRPFDVDRMTFIH